MYLIISEVKKIFKFSIITTIISNILFVIICYMIQNQYALFYNMQLWSIGGEYLSLFYIIIAVVPVCWIMVYERKNNYLAYVVPRISKLKYLLLKWLISAFSSALVMFIISFTALLFILYIFPQVDIVLPLSENDISIRVYKGLLYVKYPLLYGFLLSAWRGILAFLFSTLGYVLSLFIKNLFIVLATPFLFGIIDSFVLGTLGYSQYEIITSFDPTRVKSEVISKYTFIFSALTIIILIVILLVYYSLIKKEKIFEI
ncbi:hypothetical protein GC105_11245 [Alkalibaculum sp. M08DMB]|uniref:Uncharacterized protein n=1 Tax=Alkalibaculum sporogenes TaxID=2655001 RepID=A0A6A7KBI0_9FIRM|nr:hypothetical protein [Alkalibaculum sporogenes]MPW26363.1 hypothetical protein [Alkalibaculum sporogenes]